MTGRIRRIVAAAVGKDAESVARNAFVVGTPTVAFAIGTAGDRFGCGSLAATARGWGSRIVRELILDL